MTEAPPQLDDAHISFAKRLAHNDRKARESALRKVKRWLVTKSKHGTLDHDEIIKIWKGLHFSMWYSDKPLTQEALALDISQIITLFNNLEDAVSFFEGFCETIAREWAKIDRLRLDKYYMFIKTALKCVLEFCKSHDWNDKVVGGVIHVLDFRIINSDCPDSITTFISEQFFNVYADVYSDTMPNNTFITKLLMSYVTVLGRTPKRDLTQVIMVNLFEPLILRNQQYSIDMEQLSNHIYTVAKQPEVLTRNRKLLYQLRSDLGDVFGVFPPPPSSQKRKIENGHSDENVDTSNISSLAESNLAKKKKKKKKKKAVEENHLPEAVEVKIESSETNGLEAVEVKTESSETNGSVTLGDSLLEPEVLAGSTESVEPKATVIAESTLPTESKLPIEMTGSTELVAPDAAVAESATVIKSEAPLESPVLVESATPIESTTESTSPTESASPTESTPPVESAPPTESEPSVESATPTESEPPVESAKPTESTPATGQVEQAAPSPARRRKSTRQKKIAKTPVAEAPAPGNATSETETNVPETPVPETSVAKTPREKKGKKKVVDETPEVETKRKRKKTKDVSDVVTPMSAKKKVRVSLEKNQTLVFKKNASMESPKPFDFDRTPTKSALKASPAMTRSQSRKKGTSKVKR